MAKKRTAKQDQTSFERERINFYQAVGKTPTTAKFVKMVDNLIFFEKPSVRTGEQAMERNMTIALKQLGKSLSQAMGKALWTIMSASYVSGKYGHIKEFNKAEYMLNELNVKARSEGWTITQAKEAIKRILGELTNYKKIDHYNVELAKRLAESNDFTKLNQREIEKMQIKAKFAADESYMLAHLTEKLKTVRTLEQLKEFYSDSEIQMFEAKGWLIINEDGTIEWT